MGTPKAELRAIVLDIILEKVAVTYQPSQFGHLTAGVEEIMAQRKGGKSSSMFAREERLDEEDWQLVQEIFWDLVSERIITPGLNSSNPEFPWFRLHSEAEAKLK